ncbi:MAG TPA: D-alanyl-D-alanine dipeptidase, partial [Candidatus Eremiobacteraeota bacterium]|nr:D-alanyl-D-alanine dipeptidase [Candidatus Eremiobacteraeota bacterium]
KKSVLFLLLSIILFITFHQTSGQVPEVKLVDIGKADPTIIIDLRYATEDNFTGKKVYSVNIAYLRPEVAKKLLKVQKKLKKIGLGLKIWDAYRPLSVQYKFWELVPDLRYVADPKVGSNHNRGAAVDVTLVDSKGKELPMPTEFDDFTEKAGRNYNKLPKEVIKNRKLLEDYMVSEGFLPLPTEWWHFDYKNIKDYPVLDIPLEEVKSEK